MKDTGPGKYTNLISAILVLLAGFYVLFFMKLPISAAAKIIIGLLLLGYFILRMKLFMTRYKGD